MSDYIERYWRDATPEDAIKEPPMVARFRDDELASGSWERLTLIGYCRKTRINWRHLDGPWLDTDGDGWACCQVYDAPDPGEGWRLIDIEKDKPQEGDEIYETTNSEWKRRLHAFHPWTLSFYRRRIEQPKPEPQYEPFRWEDREQLRGRWVTWKHEDGTPIETPATYLVKKESGELLINSRNSKWFLQNASFLDTGEPVGRKVE